MIQPRSFFVLRIFAAFLGLALTAVDGQNRPIIISSDRTFPEPHPNALLDPEREETIDRGLSDLQSDDVDRRIAGVMILGKYRDIAAQEAVIRALDDAAVRVRRAATVALLEDRTSTNPGRAEALLQMLGDEDTEIRRLVSYALPTLLHQQSFSPGTGLIQPGAPAAPTPGSARIREGVLKAFQDPDVVVRRNVLAAYPYLSVRPESEVLLQLFGDEDAQVRSAALTHASRSSPRQALIQHAQPLATDPDPSIRQQLARIIGQNRIREGMPLLSTLLQDNAREVRLEASLASMQLQPDPAQAADLVDALLAGELSQEQIRTFLPTLQYLGPEGPDFLLQILAEGGPHIRMEAARLLVLHERFPHESQWIRQLVNDPADSVRQEAFQSLRFLAANTSSTLVQLLSESPHEDARDLAITLSASLPDDEAFDPLLDLILDEATTTRIRALRELHRRQFPQASTLVARSLNDPDPMIQRAAVEIMANGRRPEDLATLRSLVHERPNEPLALLVRNELRRRGIPLE